MAIILPLPNGSVYLVTALVAKLTMSSTSPNDAFDTFPVLHTERLQLIEIKQEHLGDLFRLFGTPEVTRYYNVVTLTEEGEAQKFIDFFHARYLMKAAIRWGIALKDENQIIGTIGFNNFTVNHRANIGYDLLPPFWNKGYATEALGVVLDFGFTRLGVNRIEAEVMPGNTASERLLETLGFTREGVLRQWMYWNEKHYDMTMFSLLRSEFRT